jgi:hypothetical protein
LWWVDVLIGVTDVGRVLCTWQKRAVIRQCREVSHCADRRLGKIRTYNLLFVSLDL